ncbi:hypothetical protein MGG_15502 [Pyricularia oryzae 70-15]|uniref:Uncharacterized protein n=1 Tax=Pyricularia oryzae (strain 70-15 / ATCC MYA-4617 / FGSC 8958) TaxID=242507 RepID=G4MXH4_PYRO7|nr:uncharacterized protein MGG_15502 [Pyricularia oryzae 70-15]EHA53504.1 hypothetical protein MGG_15502 [Pyricularia oryzae 70-15]
MNCSKDCLDCRENVESLEDRNKLESLGCVNKLESVEYRDELESLECGKNLEVRIAAKCFCNSSHYNLPGRNY